MAFNDNDDNNQMNNPNYLDFIVDDDANSVSFSSKPGNVSSPPTEIDMDEDLMSPPTEIDIDEDLMPPPTEIDRGGDVDSAEAATGSLQTQNDSGTVNIGDTVFDKYVILKKINVNSGEADLYLCEYEDKKYIVKFYRRKDAVDKDIIDTLKVIDSVNVAKIIESGIYKGYFTEIMNLYRNGSIEKYKGKLTFEKLKKYIFELNEGINELHKNRIIHKDIKPSNIMLSDDGDHPVIIDFGISSTVKDESGLFKTRANFTPDFTAPEAFKGIFWEGTDYYSLGITLYCLYYGRTPYEGEPGAEVLKNIAGNKIDFPGKIDKKLKGLILGLTYPDISNMDDAGSPNRRWTYREVRNWLRDIPQPVPPVGDATFVTFPEFSFAGRSYINLESLIFGMNRYWEDGKRIVFDGTLARHLKASNPDIALILDDAADAAHETKDTDLLYFSTLYKINKGMRYLLWKGHAYKNSISFGMTILEAFRDGGGFRSPTLTEMITKGAFSTYYGFIAGTGSKIYAAVEAIERKYNAAVTERNDREMITALYQLAYIMSEDSNLVYRKIYRKRNGTGIPVDKVFKSVKQLLEYLSEMLDDYSVTEYERKEFFDFLGISSESGELSPAVKVWGDKHSQLQEAIRAIIKNRNQN